MRFRRDKDGGGSAGPPDAGTRVDQPTETITAPPPSVADRVDEPAAQPPGADGAEEPTAVQPTRESEGPAKVLPPTEGEASARPPSPPPPSATDRVEAPAPAAPSATDRVESPAPPAAQATRESEGPAKVLAPPPTASTRVDAPAAAPPPQPGQLVSATAPTQAGQTACPQCGTPADAGQEMCIVCGSRIARKQSKPRGWLLPAVLAGLGVLLLGTAVAFGVVELTKDDEVKKSDVADLNEDTQPSTPPPSTRPPPAATPPTQTSPTIPPATREPDNPSGTPDTTQTTPAPTTPGGSGNEIAEWPAGKTAYTVVLVSATSRNAADAKAEQAIARGIKAGVLRSDDFATLRAGYWVVFAGQYDSSEQATRAADRYAEQGFGGGYPRQVKPK